MNKVYRIIWNSSLGLWIVASELTRGKVKSSVSTSGASAKSSSLVRSLGLAALLGVSGGAVAESTSSVWSPTTNNNYQGAVVISGAASPVDVTGPSSISGGQESGYTSITIQQAIDQGYTVGSADPLKNLLYIDVGTQNKGIVIQDPVMGAISFNVYNSANFSQRAAGSDGTEKVLVLNDKPADFFYKTRFVTVNTGGGTANFHTDLAITGTYKDSQLAYADGRGAGISTINWTSSNEVMMYGAAAFTPSDALINKTVTSYAYKGAITAYDGSTWTINNAADLQAYNDWLIVGLQKTVGESGYLSSSQYSAELAKAMVADTHAYVVDRTKGGSVDPAYTADNGIRAVMYGVGANATVRLATGAELKGYAPGSGVILTATGATGINDGRINVVGYAMRAVSGGQLINNGEIAVWRQEAVGGTSGNGIGMSVANTGSLGTNSRTGVINVNPWNNTRNSPLDKNIGMHLREGGAGINHGVINLTAAATQNDSVSATEGARVDSGGSTFTNATDGLMTIGISAAGQDIHSAPGSKAISVLAGSGYVENAGEILMGKLVNGAYGISADNAGTVNVVNSGKINIKGFDNPTPAQNVGIYANASTGLVNTGEINLLGVNGVGLKAINGGLISSSGVINVYGADVTSGLRNYGGWAEVAVA